MGLLVTTVCTVPTIIQIRNSERDMVMRAEMGPTCPAARYNRSSWSGTSRAPGARASRVENAVLVRCLKLGWLDRTVYDRARCSTCRTEPFRAPGVLYSVQFFDRVNNASRCLGVWRDGMSVVLSFFNPYLACCTFLSKH